MPFIGVNTVRFEVVDCVWSVYHAAVRRTETACRQRRLDGPVVVWYHARMVSQSQVNDMVWGKTPAGVYPGALLALREAYTSGANVTLIMDDDSARVGVVIRYDSFDIDLKMGDGTCKHMSTDNVVKVFVNAS